MKPIWTITKRELYAYYGRSYATAAPAGRRQTGETDRGKDRDKASMVRSEEELTVDKHRQEAGRVKLRKWVETERERHEGFDFVWWQRA